MLISVLVIAFLYFGLMELMLIESAQAMRGAQRFRSRVVAHTLAENAVELAAHQILDSSGKTVTRTSNEGTMEGRSRWLAAGSFEIEGVGVSQGSYPQSASVRVLGCLMDDAVLIHRTVHSQ